jgi:hypothetical protein
MIQKKFLTRLVKYDKNISSMGLVVHSKIIFAYVDLVDDLVPSIESKEVKIMVKAGTNDDGAEPGVYAFDRIASISSIASKIKKLDKNASVAKLGDDVMSIGDQTFGMTFHPDVKSTIGLGWSALKWKGDVLKNLSTLLDGVSSNRFDRYVVMTDRRCFRTDSSFMSYILNGHRLKDIAIGHVFMRPMLSMMGKLTGMGTGGHRTAWQFENGAISVEWPNDMSIFRLLCGPIAPQSSPEWREYAKRYQLDASMYSPLSQDMSDWPSIGLVAYDSAVHKKIHSFGDAAIIQSDGKHLGITNSVTGESLTIKLNEGAVVTKQAKMEAKYLARALDIIAKQAGRYKDKISFEVIVNPRYAYHQTSDVESTHPALVVIKRNNLNVMIAGTTNS